MLRKIGFVAIWALFSSAISASAATYDFTFVGGKNDPTVSGSGTFTTNAANNLVISGSGTFTIDPQILKYELGTDDNPIFAGVYDYSALAAGATLLGAKMVASGRLQVAFNPVGGFHHAAKVQLRCA